MGKRLGLHRHRFCSLYSTERNAWVFIPIWNKKKIVKKISGDLDPSRIRQTTRFSFLSSYLSFSLIGN
ncbi:hypothetical protein AQUCO_00201437v1 [Aquilegia coerulea]|uniref:Uncharacterized protein n=1 Tax=Aquilegia coerulea TaxID=218851 RepID=A0A2G5F833_AQUCA|nr:hypothetical protein AQUCO_00201437v1 [Aquilegia coerulea]